MTASLAPVEPTSLESVESTCVGIEEWAVDCESIPQLRDATNRLAAIDEYLARTSTEGRSRVAAAQRRLEVRIGQLLGPAKVGAHYSAKQGREISPRQRHEFRRMAQHEDQVERVISESDDTNPPSRRKVMHAITKPNTGDVRTRTFKGRDAAEGARRVINTLVGLTHVIDQLDRTEVAPTADEAASWERDLAAAASAINRYRKRLKEHSNG